jgi:hypothetical protein
MRYERVFVRSLDSRLCLRCAFAFVAIAVGVTGVSADWPWKREKADFPKTLQVAKIEVEVFGFPSGTVEQERSIDDKKRIVKALAILERCREGWKKVVWTEANGDVVINFRSVDVRAVWPLGQVRMGKGWISTYIGGHCHSRTISAKDQGELLKALGVDSSVLEHRTEGAGKRADSRGAPLVHSSN